MDQLKVGIIGCGKFALAAHLPNCRRLDNIRLWHCCDQIDSRRRAAEEFGPQRISTDYRDLLSDPDVEMVILAVPHDVHAFFIEEAVRAGKHVLCEKPMTMTLDESYRVIRAVRQKGVKLCVDFNRRFSPAMIDLKNEYLAHKKGPRNKPRVHAQESGRPEWAEERTSSILIRIQDECLTYGGVHIDWMVGGGQIIGESCHWLDLMCWLLEERPVRIFGAGSTRLDHILSIEFESGSLGCLFFGTHGSFEYPKELLEIQSHAKFFRSECFVENQYFGCGDRTIKQFPMQDDSMPENSGQEGHLGYLKKLDAMGSQFQETGALNFVSPDKGHLGLLRAFVDSILQDQPSPVDEMAGMRATYLSLRAIESIRTGIPLPINITEWEMYIHGH